MEYRMSSDIQLDLKPIREVKGTSPVDNRHLYAVHVIISMVYTIYGYEII